MMSDRLSAEQEKFVTEAMAMINRLTPDIKEKAFSPDWFLLRQFLEGQPLLSELTAVRAEVERLNKQLNTQADLFSEKLDEREVEVNVLTLVVKDDQQRITELETSVKRVEELERKNAELLEVAKEAQRQRISELERRTTAQEAITLHWQPRVEELEKALRSAAKLLREELVKPHGAQVFRDEIENIEKALKTSGDPSGKEVQG